MDAVTFSNILGVIANSLFVKVLFCVPSDLLLRVNHISLIILLFSPLSAHRQNAMFLHNKNEQQGAPLHCL